METEAQVKQEKLEALLRKTGGLLVAYSGGVDSAYLAWCAHRVLGNKMTAIIADSPSLARRHLREALRFAAAHGFQVEVIRTAEFDNPEYVKNDASRCFHCKNELFSVMEKIRARFANCPLAYGMNLDDKGDYRPGQKAASLHGVLAPLVDAGLSKGEIRFLARQGGLEVWDKPASPCLSSRVAYGLAVNEGVLERVEAAEEFLWDRGFRAFRVRDHGEIARIEIARKEMAEALSLAMFDAISARFKEIGFKYVALDCSGYQTGSMNLVLDQTAKLASQL